MGLWQQENQEKKKQFVRCARSNKLKSPEIEGIMFTQSWNYLVLNDQEKVVDIEYSKSPNSELKFCKGCNTEFFVVVVVGLIVLPYIIFRTKGSEVLALSLLPSVMHIFKTENHCLALDNIKL